jgi:ParB family chromosome partitioning protein
LQPILVRPRPTGGYEIVAGERRYRAALRAGLKSVPVVIRALSDEDTLAVALIENLIREDIGPMETARAFQRLMADFAWTQEEMARRVGKSRPAVANSLRLLALPEVIQASVERGEISEGHARTLIGDERQRSDPAFRERQLRIWEQIRARSLSVRDAERLMKTDPRAGRSVAGANEPAARCESAADFSALEDRLRDALGTQIRLIGADSRGRIEIEFFSAAELDDLVTKFESLTPGRLSGDRSRSRPGSDRNPAPRSSRNPSE